MSQSRPAQETFEEHLRQVNLAGARLAYVLAAVLVPATAVLDLATVPDRVWEFLGIRVLASTLAVLGWALTFSPPLRRHPVLLGAGPPLLCATAIEVMILRLEGPTSSYYAGLNLCILAVAVMYTWTWRQSLLVSGTILAMWLIPALPWAMGGGLDYQLFVNNLVFLVLTAVIAVASAVIRYRAAEREHRVRFKLAQTSEELSETLERLQELDRMKNEFFANISHELRTPLTLILSPVEELLTEKIEPKLRSTLSIVRRNAQRLLRLIDDLLDLSRLDDGGLRLNLAEVNPNELAERVTQAAMPAAESKGLVVEFVGAKTLPTTYADPHRLEIILTNLIGNALKFTPTGGKIRVSVAADSKLVKIMVSDTGPGIALANQERIFSRFFQVEGSERRKQGGAGIGLSLARRLAELHGGSLSVRSELGRGAEFCLTLLAGREHFGAGVVERRRVRAESHPGRRAEDRTTQLVPTAEPAPVVSTPKEPSEIRLSHGRRARVLVAEDETDLRDFIVGALNDEFDVLLAEDGAQALSLVKSERPDLVLTDVMMPNMSGTELCRAIKSDTQLAATPVIVLTARSSADSTLEGYSAGADDFIAKPFHTRVLVARVKAQLKLRSLGLRLADQARLATAGALAAGIAHEIKNPLNAVLNAARAVRGLPLDDSARSGLLKTIEVGAGRISDIVSVVEDHVRPAEGAEKSVCEVEGGVNSTLRLLGAKLGGIRVHYDESATHHVVASGRELNQVIMNLLDNAVNAGPANIWIRVGQESPSDSVDNDVVELSISDDGRGIERDVEPLIFEPFFTTRSGGQGTGLGLYLSRRIINECGGELSYCRRIEGGSTFVVRLPALRAVA